VTIKNGTIFTTGNNFSFFLFFGSGAQSNATRRPNMFSYISLYTLSEPRIGPIVMIYVTFVQDHNMLHAKHKFLAL
jgi:hypothetical protein